MNHHQPDTHGSSATSGDELLALVDTEMRLCSGQLQASVEKVSVVQEHLCSLYLTIAWRLLAPIIIVNAWARSIWCRSIIR